MYPFIDDDPSMRSQMEERLRRAEHARLANDARRARKTRSHRPAMEAKGHGTSSIRRHPGGSHWRHRC